MKKKILNDGELPVHFEAATASSVPNVMLATGTGSANITPPTTVTVPEIVTPTQRPESEHAKITPPESPGIECASITPPGSLLTDHANITPPSGDAMKEFKEVCNRWLDMADDAVVDFMFGVVLANRLDGDPVWGGIMGASGDTKTELLRSLEDDSILHLSNLTSKTLISGLPKDMNKGKETSLLDRLDGRILVVKDLTPIISGNADTRSAILGQLRDAYDGSSSMAFGTGEVKSFNSKFGFLFGVTPAIESCWPVINQLGERFLYFRCKEGDRMAKVEAAYRNSNQKPEMRSQMIQAASGVLNQGVFELPEISYAEECQIMHIADFVALARTPVSRMGRTQEVSHTPAPEVGTRLVGQFSQLARGIAAARGLSSCDKEVMKALHHVALSGIPKNRMDLIRRLFGRTGSATTKDLGQAARLGSGTVHRVLEDLWTLKIVERQYGGTGHSHTWRLTGWARKKLEDTGLIPPS